MISAFTLCLFRHPPPSRAPECSCKHIIFVRVFFEGLRWHLVQPQYITYSSYHVTLTEGREEVIRHQLAAYGARDVEKVGTYLEQTLNL